MTTTQQIDELLTQLQQQTGVAFAIDATDADLDETVQVLQQLLRSCHSSTSQEGFLRELLLGLLSAAEISHGLNRLNLPKQQLLLPLLLESRQALSAMAHSVLTQYLGTGDYLIPLDEFRVCILHRVTPADDSEDFMVYAEELCAFMEAEAFTSVKLAFHTACNQITELPQLFEGISSTMDIGSALYPDQQIFCAKDLGLGQVISELSPEACQKYLADHFAGLALSDLDEETLHTITVFLESGLNIAECARKLYLHRNTLIYRLDKIQKLTGLDIRRFGDAMTCKLALMMSAYLLNC